MALRSSIKDAIRAAREATKNARQKAQRAAVWFKNKLAKSNERPNAKNRPNPLTGEGGNNNNGGQPPVQFAKRMVIGEMYSFRYDAKHKKTLPFWDANPLIILIGFTANGWYGMNLHYLPPRIRAIFLNRLKDLATNPSNGSRRRLKLTYQLLSNASKFKFFRPTIHQYLKNHVRSNIVLIPYDEWDFAISLPTADWQKASASQVYKDSLSKI